MLSRFRRLKLNLGKFWLKIRPHPLMPRRMRVWRWALIVAGSSVLVGFFLGILLIIVFSFNLPPVTSGEGFLQAESTIIYDRSENVLYAIQGDENRKIVALADMSPYLISATLSTEDDQFYYHYGFDVPCLGKAFLHELFGIGGRRGCSTITQQFVKNFFLTQEQTYTRKIQELILAVRVESHYSKDEILEMYLNEIFYGNNAYGIELAANRYFGVLAKDLTLTQSAILAAIPKAPTYYSPYGENSHSYLTLNFTAEQLAARNISSIQDLEDDEFMLGLIGSNITLVDGTTIYLPGRTDVVLNSMLEKGIITEEEKQTALEESWTLEFQSYLESIQAPHFVFYVKQLVEEKYGKEVLEQGGLRIYTTLDPNLQDIAEASVEKYKENNLESFDASNASLVAIQPQTGQILAMVGSADYRDPTINGEVNIATRYRQPGSSFKPFVYALAFLNGYAPATILYDVKTQFGTEAPKNYSGTFSGPVSIRYALGQSLNIPAIKTYFLAGQEDAIIPFVEKFGINLDKNIGYGWPLALGTGEVRLLDFTGAYSVFANSGIKKEITPILKIENRNGDILEQWKDTPGTEVLDPQAAYLINNILSDSSVHLGSRLSIAGQHVAAKTGTSTADNGYPTNTWTMGYTTNLVTGVWVGNADGTIMNYLADGYNCAAPIWNDFMTQALAEFSSEEFPKPQGITSLTITKSTGLLPAENTPEDMLSQDIFATFDVPTQIDNSFISYPIDKMTGLIATEFSPAWSVQEKAFQVHQTIIPEYTYWQAGIDAWVEANADLKQPPTEQDTLHTAETLANSPTIAITSPANYGSIDSGRTTIEVEVSTPNGMDYVEFYLNDQIQYTAVTAPYSGTIRLGTSVTPGKTYTLTAYVYDALGYRSNSTIEVQYGTTSTAETPTSTEDPAPPATPMERP
ncbi:MAG: transglycosylase domain-containing protein [Candidatus Gracilibacteria bacterium]